MRGTIIMATLFHQVHEQLIESWEGWNLAGSYMEDTFQFHNKFEIFTNKILKHLKIIFPFNSIVIIAMYDRVTVGLTEQLTPKKEAAHLVYAMPLDDISSSAELQLIVIVASVCSAVCLATALTLVLRKYYSKISSSCRSCCSCCNRQKGSKSGKLIRKKALKVQRSKPRSASDGQLLNLPSGSKYEKEKFDFLERIRKGSFAVMEEGVEIEAIQPLNPVQTNPSTRYLTADKKRYSCPAVTGTQFTYEFVQPDTAETAGQSDYDSQADSDQEKISSPNQDRRNSSQHQDEGSFAPQWRKLVRLFSGEVSRRESLQDSGYLASTDHLDNVLPGEVCIQLQYEGSGKDLLMLTVKNVTNVFYKNTEQVYVLFMMIPERMQMSQTKSVPLSDKMEFHNKFLFEATKGDPFFFASRTLVLRIICVLDTAEFFTYGEARLPLINQPLFSHVPKEVVLPIKAKPNHRESGYVEIALCYKRKTHLLSVSINTVKLCHLSKDASGLHLALFVKSTIDPEAAGEKKTLTREMKVDTPVVHINESVTFHISQETLTKRKFKMLVYTQRTKSDGSSARDLFIGTVRIGYNIDNYLHWNKMKSRQNNSWPMWHPICKVVRNREKR